MRSPLLAAAFLPGLLLLAPVASAETTTTTEPTPQPLPVWLNLSAYSGHPGEKVSVAAACADDASPLTTEALQVTEPLARNAEGHQPWALFAETVIRDVPQASYPVSFHCGGEPVTVHFTVLAKEKATTPAKQPAPSTTSSAADQQVSKVPKGAPQTGDGSLTDNVTLP
ncbi:MAG TPA: hypothetical protein VJ870_02695 [Amycolatopsis sp.]|nr:hypothetical protein [Amycolatopsis sp.]